MPVRDHSQPGTASAPALKSFRALAREPMRAATIAVMLMAVTLAGCSKNSPTTAPGAGAPPYIGLTSNPTDATFADSLGSAILTSRALGSNFFQMGELWSTLEPSPGSVQLGTLRSTLDQLAALGFTPYYNLRVLDTNRSGVPADLLGHAFDDPALVSRTDAIVDTLIGVFQSHPIAAFSFGNEVDAYLGAHPAELAAFRALMTREIGRVHARLPGLPIGCCTQSPPQNSFAWVGDTLNRYTDVAIYTYYPFQPGSDFVHRPTTTFEPDMAAMLARNPSRPIALQEVGYSSSAINGSSPAAQADFVRRFRNYFAAQPRSRVLFASWFLMTDWSSSTLNTLFAYYGFVSPGFSEYLGNLGLRDSVGVPKPGWDAWKHP
ncbi:MAG: hypothetical protein ACRENS_01560 [Candidatus Eiseniibacteriota bacterium]